MRTPAIFSVLSAVAALAATPAAAAYIYTPSEAYDTAEGNANNSLMAPTEDRRLQWLYRASIFGDAPLLIEGLAFRFDKIVSDDDPGLLSVGADFELRMATLPGSLSSTFDDNLAGAKTVMSGAQKIPYAYGAPAGQTKPFGIVFDFATPYRYDPAQGNLVIDLYMPALQFVTIDFVAGNSLQTRVFSLDATADTGSVQRYGPVTRFEVSAAVPEPAAWALMIGGFATAGAALRRRRRLPQVASAG